MSKTRRTYWAVVNKNGDLVDYEEYGGLAFNSKEELLFAYKNWKHLGREVLKNYEWKIIKVHILPVLPHKRKGKKK